MAARAELVDFLDELLKIGDIPEDKSANGLQVEGSGEVRRVLGAVDACQAAYREAIRRDGDFLFVHHGEFWGEGMRRLVGPTAERFRLLFKHDLSLYAAHLPLDADPELGHNACLARMLELVDPRPFAGYAGAEVGIRGTLTTPLSVEALSGRLDEQLETRCQVVGNREREIRQVGIVSGAGASAIAECRDLGLDCLVTGEVGHTDYHPVHELNMTVIAAGHYKTEMPGVKAVLERVQAHFGIDCEFIDLPTGL